jgi:hypothetical protein
MFSRACSITLCKASILLLLNHLHASYCTYL